VSVPAALSGLQVFYGGTFDPVHNGHIAIAESAAAALHTQVWLMPAADPPHRAPPGADADQRARMLQLAVAGRPQLQVDLRELERARRRPGVPSWTVDTLRELRQQLGPRQPIALLMGADSLLGLPAWHEWEALTALAHIVVAERPGSALDGVLPPLLEQHLHAAWVGAPSALAMSPAGRVWRMQQPLHTESATAVRELIGGHGDWRALLPAAVADYIQVQGLYGCQRP